MPAHEPGVNNRDGHPWPARRGAFKRFRRLKLIVKGYPNLDVGDFCGVASTGVAEALGEGAAALAGYFDETAVVGDLLEQGQGVNRLGEHPFIEVVLKLQERVVDAQPVVLDAPLQEFDKLL